MKLNLKNVPNTLDDCSKKQIIKILKIASDNTLAPLIKRVKLFYILIEDQGNFFNKISYWYQLSFKLWWVKTGLGKFVHSEEGLNIDITLSECDFEELSYDVEDYTEFLFSEDEILLKQKLKRIGLFKVGPTDYFGNLTFKQFREADSEFYQMLEQKEQSGKLEISNAFINALYTDFFPFIYHAKSNLTEHEKKLILMYYVGNRRQLALEFPYVFKPKSSNKTSEFSKMMEYSDMWENILDTIAEKPQFYSIVDRLNVRSVLKNLDQKFAKDEAIKTAYEQSGVY